MGRNTEVAKRAVDAFIHALCPMGATVCGCRTVPFMQTKAAVLWEINQPWSVEDVELDAPGPGEVRVKLAASGPVPLR